MKQYSKDLGYQISSGGVNLASKDYLDKLNFAILLFTALKELHSLGYVHNDLKPDNIAI